GGAVLGAIMVAQISTVGQADLSVTNLPLAMKDSIGNLLTSGLTGGVAPALPPGLSPAILGTVHSVITDAITQGVRLAVLTAGIFVSFGALSSLLIPNPKAMVSVMQETRVPAAKPVAPMAETVCQMPNRRQWKNFQSAHSLRMASVDSTR